LFCTRCAGLTQADTAMHMAKVTKLPVNLGIAAPRLLVEPTFPQPAD